MCVQYCNTETNELQQCFECNKHYARAGTCWSNWRRLDEAHSRCTVDEVANRIGKAETKKWSSQISYELHFGLIVLRSLFALIHQDHRLPRRQG